ncbi:MAG: signal peptide peptidase SppA [Betaproteobacteria bacterium]|nr:signal peptide peptidase SppA [Betaproteobacteria bacterium]
MSSVPGLLRRVFSGFWSALDTSRRVFFNLIFLIVLAFIIAVIFKEAPELMKKTVLVLGLTGKLVEQRSGSTREQLLSEVQGGTKEPTQLRDVLAVLDAAAKDSRIERVVLTLDEFDGSGPASLHEVASALERFKDAGKQVIAWGGHFNQRSYYLAAHANEVFMHPMGVVMLEGYGRYRNYYKDALDRLGIQANVLRVGTYKSFGEPYTSNAPSKATIEADTFLYNDLWATYTGAVEKARKLPAGAINKGIEEITQRFAVVNGNPGKLALESRLVDGLKTRDEFRELMIQRGAKDEENKTFRQVSFNAYLGTLKPKRGDDAIAVVVAEGEISDGIAPPGRIGGRSTAELIRKARDDDKVKALVLRVNSPGGSAFGSELIRRELELTRIAGKPVVVSMGNVAASGGYWISMAADETIADPATITGSIGVIAMLPTGEKAMEKLSIATGGVTTTWLGGAYDPRHGLDPRFAQLVQAAIGNIYTEFTGKAAVARKTTPEKINDVGQGRVWTGNQARERGLIDRTGSFGDAIKSAAAKAKLGDDARVIYVETERTPFEKLISQLGGAQLEAWIQTMVGNAANNVLPLAALPDVAREVRRDLAWILEAADQAKSSGNPFAAYTHCLCVAE